MKTRRLAEAEVLPWGLGHGAGRAEGELGLACFIPAHLVLLFYTWRDGNHETFLLLSKCVKTTGPGQFLNPVEIATLRDNVPVGAHAEDEARRPSRPQAGEEPGPRMQPVTPSGPASIRDSGSLLHLLLLLLLWASKW